MSAIHLDNRLLHYEIFGRGQPIIFLHSWIGSWRYWVPTMDLVAERYRAYALDFWGFGESDRHGDSFTINDYVEMVCRFMEQMGIRQANLVGHGLGGMVAIRTARERPDRILKVMTVCTPLQGTIMTNLMKQGTLTRLLGRSNPTNIWTKMIRQMNITDADVRQELLEDTDSIGELVVQRVQESILETDLRPALAALDQRVPLLAVYGEKDTIVPAEHALFMNEASERPHQHIVIQKAGHFPFLEQSNIFNRMVMDFMVSEGSPVEIKNEWRRRVMQREFL